MKIQNTLFNNVGLMSEAGSRLLLAAGATHDIPDATWAPYAENAAGMIADKTLVIVEAAKLSDEMQKAKDAEALEAAKALIAASKNK